jgi:protocatechuate 3,4-dioxygenase beta subunit
MDNDDRPVGRVLSRREVIGLLGIGGAALLGGRALGQGGPGGRRNRPQTANGCYARPELTEGPFFVDEKLNRSDIRTDANSKIIVPGVPLKLAVTVHSFAGGGCSLLKDAMVDIWHCDAYGRYSDVRQNDTAGQKWLRGYQMTDKDGLARFTTIYPGWYRGRTVHIHFKIRVTKNNRPYEFTSQWFFDDALSDKILAQAPYNQTGRRDMLNRNDGIYREGGEQMLLNLKPDGDGYSAAFDVGLDV